MLPAQTWPASGRQVDQPPLSCVSPGAFVKDTASGQKEAFVPFNRFFCTALLSVTHTQLSFGTCVKRPPQARSQRDISLLGSEVSACVRVQGSVRGSPAKGSREADAPGRARAGGGEQKPRRACWEQQGPRERGEAAGRGPPGRGASWLCSVPGIPDTASSLRLALRGRRALAGPCRCPRVGSHSGHCSEPTGAEQGGSQRAGRLAFPRPLTTGHEALPRLPLLCSHHCWVSGPFSPLPPHLSPPRPVLSIAPKRDSRKFGVSYF